MDQRQSRPVRISVVIPVHNEEGTIEKLAAELQTVLRNSYEIIFVDDGSTDDTWQRLLEIHLPGRIRLIRLCRNLGKSRALVTGFAASQGDIVLTLDGDLQDDPAEIPRFLDKLEEGYDLVIGWKKIRRDSRSKVISSRLFNGAVRLLTGLELHDVNCGFKAMRGDLARRLKLAPGHHRFIPVFAAALGFRVAEIAVVHHPRRHGHSKYGFSRAIQGPVDLVKVVLMIRFGRLADSATSEPTSAEVVGERLD